MRPHALSAIWLTGLLVISWSTFSEDCVFAAASSDWNWLSDGASFSETIPREKGDLEDDFQGDVYLQETFFSDFDYPVFYHYNASLLVGRDGSHQALWFSLRPDVYYGDRTTWPSELSAAHYFLPNATVLATRVIFHNAQIVEMIAAPSIQTFPLHIGSDGPGNDGLELSWSDDIQDVAAIQGPTEVIVDLYARSDHDNFGMRLTVQNHPAWVSFHQIELDAQRYANRPSYTNRLNAIPISSFQVGQNRSTIEFGQRLPLTEARLVGGAVVGEEGPIILDFRNPVARSAYLSPLFQLLVVESVSASQIAAMMAACLTVGKEWLEHHPTGSSRQRKTKRRREGVIRNAILKNTKR